MDNNKWKNIVEEKKKNSQIILENLDDSSISENEKKQNPKEQNAIHVENIEINEKNKEDIEYKKFLQQQKALDEDKSLTVATGKITLKEMKLDQLKPMKNKVRGFYYVKKEDIGQTQEFQLEINGKVEGNEDNVDISSLIIDQYEA